MQRRTLAALLSVATSLGFGIGSASACTDVVLNKTKGIVVSGRTLDYDSELGSKICFRSRGSQVTDPNVKFTKGGFSPLSWTSKHDVVLVDAFELPAYADGMNDQGLSMGCLWHFETEPAKAVQAGTNGLANVSLVQYVLENAADIEEAKKLMSGLSLFMSNYMGTDMVLHWIITEKSGRSVVMELKDGRPKFFDEVTEVGVLTNSPCYDQHIAHLKTHHESCAKDPNYSLPGDYRPTSRFVKAAYLVDTTPQLKSCEEGLNTVLQIMHNVEVPKGAQKTGSYTQWMALCDHANLRYMVVTSAQPTSAKIVDLRKIDFKQAAGKRIPLDGPLAADLAQVLGSQASAATQN